MHVTAVVPNYPPGSRVGAWLATHNLLRALVDRGHTVEVVPMMRREKNPYRLGGVCVLPVSERERAISEADVIISHLGDSGATHKRALALRTPSVKMVHGGVFDRRLLVGAALAVCNSEATRIALARWQGRKVVIHPPTDPALYRTSPGDMITLVNLASAKGGDLFWRIAEAMPEQQFLGVMGGYAQQVVKKLDNVEVIPVTSNMRDDVYGRTKILLMPSSAESWGMVAIEAMCSGVPVIAKPTPGLREALGRAGIFQDGNNVSAWVDKINGLKNPEAWSKASGEALARVEQLDPEDSKRRFVMAIEALI